MHDFVEECELPGQRHLGLRIDRGAILSISQGNSLLRQLEVSNVLVGRNMLTGGERRAR